MHFKSLHFHFISFHAVTTFADSAHLLYLLWL